MATNGTAGIQSWNVDGSPLTEDQKKDDDDFRDRCAIAILQGWAANSKLRLTVDEGSDDDGKLYKIAQSMVVARRRAEHDRTYSGRVT